MNNNQIEKDYDNFMLEAPKLFFSWNNYTINQKDAEFFKYYAKTHSACKMYYCFINTKETKNYYPECDWPRKELPKQMYEHRKFKKLFKGHNPIRFLNRVIFSDFTNLELILQTYNFGEDGLKADTWYKLDSNGNFEEITQ